MRLTSRALAPGDEVVLRDGTKVVLHPNSVSSILRRLGRRRAPARKCAAKPAVVAAVPVAPLDTLTRLEREGDEVVCLPLRSRSTRSVWYQSFLQLDDSQVRDILDRHAGEIGDPSLPLVHEPR